MGHRFQGSPAYVQILFKKNEKTFTVQRVYREDDDDRHVDSKETISMSLAMKVDDSTQVRIKLID
jgi:hypothetical protein